MTGLALLAADIPLEVPRIADEFATTTGRPWLVDLAAVPLWAKLGAVVPALMATILLFLDQNITSRLVNSPSHQLRKGYGFHLDLLIVGLITAICSLFGLPWVVAATVYSLNHVKGLVQVETTVSDAFAYERIVSVRESRRSAFSIHVLVATSFLMLPLIHLIPMPVLFGLFLYMGIAALGGNQFFMRMKLWITDTKHYPNTRYTRAVRSKVMHRFTLIQLICLFCLWILKASFLGIIFPVLIALLVPLRMLLARYFSATDLADLDASDSEELQAKQLD